MKTIPLTRGYVALVDDADYDDLIQFKWYAQKSDKGRTFYASRHIYIGERRTLEAMHTRITGYNETDHKDGNGLNNQRSNLRSATTSQNKANQPKYRGTYSSQYKGVCWNKNRDKWQANIRGNGKGIYLGIFTDEIEAAKAYDRAAVEYFGEYASLNFPQVS